MALAKALGLGMIAAISVPHVLRNDGSSFGQASRWLLVHPPVGSFGLSLSIPILLIVAASCWALLKAAEEG